LSWLLDLVIIPEAASLQGIVGLFGLSSVNNESGTFPVSLLSPLFHVFKYFHRALK
jgi:hypothetical protein